MKELKKHKSISDQICMLKSRGLFVSDIHAAEQTLFNISYYRLTGYLHDFKKPNTDLYVENTSWKQLKRIYDFDRRLTRILLYALEDIEESLKTRTSYIITSHFPDDPLIYIRPTIYQDYATYIGFLSIFYAEVENNKSLPFVKHHINNYGGFLPMWVAVELLTMGNLHAFYNNLETKYQKEIAKSYNTGCNQLSNWIKNLTYTRNHLAHCMRIYNFNFGRTPAKCRNHNPNNRTTNMIFDQICVMSYMYSDNNEWNNYIIPEIDHLIEEYSPDISINCIGFPIDWKMLLMKQ